jgi:hypothetical protein
MHICIYCGNELSELRVGIGKEYCMEKDCVSKGISSAMANFRLVLMPKQGFTYVKVDSDDLNHGRSSGR